MTEKTYREALTDALFLEMRRDENVFVMGEDVVGGTGSPHAEPGFVGGVFGVTGGLHEEFGLDRCIDMIISATGLLPAKAAPAAVPAIPASEIGISIHLSSPNSSCKPPVTPKTPPTKPGSA
jgi:pyruvate dehydrogenase E1 component beta subunit